MIRKSLLILAAIGLMLAITACSSKDNNESSTGSSSAKSESTGSKGNDSDKEVTLKFLNISEYIDSTEFTDFLERFHAKYPNIKIDPISVPHEEYISKRNIMLASGEQVDLVWGNGVEQFDAINKGFLMPINDIAKEVDVDMTKDFGDFKPDKDGKYYRFPIQQNNWLLYYNKKVFDDANVPYPDATVPMTWEEMADVAEKITDLSGKEKVYGMFYNNWGMYFYGYGSQLNGGKFYTDEGNANINAPEFKRSLEFMNDVMNVKKAAVPIAEFIQNNTDFLSYWNGNYGMVVGAQWYAQLAATQKEKFPRDWKTGIAPMPVPTEMAGKHMNWSSIDSLGIPKNSKNAKEALIFAKEYVADYTFSTGALPMYTKVNKDKYFEDLAHSLQDDDITLEEVTYLFGGDSNVINVEEKPILGAPQEYESTFLDIISQYYTGSKTVDEVLNEVKEKVDLAIEEQKNN
ncbi:ABC transporter substrate-binding protein [Paenibacillus yanchengensis]|uniref:ABC transporter substrate-binding protein n=1 Tax=Paenibacillus yanchengensis TaxID=2035833 RepID=A0ABW4YF78_9BACL